jgi:hypothetical protein
MENPRYINELTGVAAKMDCPVLFKIETSAGRHIHDATHNVDCNCLRSDMHRLRRPDERAVSWYKHKSLIPSH